MSCHLVVETPAAGRLVFFLYCPLETAIHRLQKAGGPEKSPSLLPHFAYENIEPKVKKLKIFFLLEAVL